VTDILNCDLLHDNYLQQILITVPVGWIFPGKNMAESVMNEAPTSHNAWIDD